MHEEHVLDADRFASVHHAGHRASAGEGAAPRLLVQELTPRAIRAHALHTPVAAHVRHGFVDLFDKIGPNLRRSREQTSNLARYLELGSSREKANLAGAYGLQNENFEYFNTEDPTERNEDRREARGLYRGNRQSLMDESCFKK